MILPDAPLGKEGGLNKNLGPLPLQVIPTGPVNPAKKRDIGLQHARGEIIAFLDDDAYPAKDWLKNAMVNFTDKTVAAVGGPAITPPGDSLLQKASGAVFSTPLVSAGYSYRYQVRAKRKVVDYPSCNFLVRRSAMIELGGFNTDFWPGEDTKLCLDIIKKLKRTIIYDPAVLVYHHRRKMFAPHLKQIANYARTRGYFVKQYPETSFKPAYFIPSVFLLCVFLGAVLSIFSSYLRMVYLYCLAFYLTMVLIFGISSGLKVFVRGWNPGQKAILIIDIFAGIILSHFYYGFYFIKGLFSKGLKEERLQ